MNEWMKERMNKLTSERINESMNQWMSEYEWIIERPIERMKQNEWVNDRTIERKKQTKRDGWIDWRTNAEMNEWIKLKDRTLTISSVIECVELFFLGVVLGSFSLAFFLRASSCQCRAEAATMDQCSELFIIISSQDRLKGLCPMSPPTPLSVRSTSTSNLGCSSDDKKRLDHLEDSRLFR